MKQDAAKQSPKAQFFFLMSESNRADRAKYDVELNEDASFDHKANLTASDVTAECIFVDCEYGDLPSFDIPVKTAIEMLEAKGYHFGRGFVYTCPLFRRDSSSGDYELRCWESHFMGAAYQGPNGDSFERAFSDADACLAHALSDALERSLFEESEFAAFVQRAA